MVPQANAFVPLMSRSYTAPLTFRNTDYRRVCYPQFAYGLSEYDACLHRDRMIWDELVACGGLQQICCPKGRPPYTQRPWVAMPKEGRRFKPISTLLVDDAIPFTGVDVAVMQVRVPVGYDGVISDVCCEIVPGPGGVTGFLEGSGDITWRLAANTRFLRDLGNLKVSVGSLTTPSPVPRGMLRVYSQDLLTFFVNFAIGAEASISNTARIVCSITGWFYPR